MLNSSLRRVALPHPTTSLPIRSITSLSHGTIGSSLVPKGHQRRHSSSKPPIPPRYGGIPIPAASVKQVGGPRSTDKRPASEVRQAKKRTTKEKDDASTQEDEVYNEWTKTLPSVPSTQHIHPKDVYTASFFSTHRPISITNPLPAETSINDIDKIFQLKPQRTKPKDVIFTISNFVSGVENETAQQQDQAPQAQQAVTQRADLIKALTQHNDHAPKTSSGTPTPTRHFIHIDAPQPRASSSQPIRYGGSQNMITIDVLRGRQLPYHKPPVPEALPEFKFNFGTTNILGDLQGLSTKEISPSDALSIFASPDTTESVTHEITRASPSRRRRSGRGTLTTATLARISMVRRRMKWDKVRMLLISVKRQRKMKMKKHKLKKLQKRTRNLKKKLGKI